MVIFLLFLSLFNNGCSQATINPLVLAGFDRFGDGWDSSSVVVETESGKILTQISLQCSDIELSDQILGSVNETIYIFVTSETPKYSWEVNACFKCSFVL